MKREQIYRAGDGEIFYTAGDCQEHESKAFIGRLANLNEEQILAAIERKPHCLALAADLERAGNLIAAKRRADGDMKRRKKPAGEEEKFTSSKDTTPYSLHGIEPGK